MLAEGAIEDLKKLPRAPGQSEQWPRARSAQGD